MFVFMCTNAVSVNVRQMADKFSSNVMIPNHKGLSEDELVEKVSGDVRPTDLAVVITHNRPREFQYMRWGLIPAFVKDLKAVSPMYNAKAETLTEKASFKDLIMASRCLILNEGFYESQKFEHEKIEWKISPSLEEHFYKAGLWTTWRNPANGELIDSFTMITCDPQQTEFSHVHDRMPIIMTQPERRLWMNPNATKEQLLTLLKPCDASMYSITEYERKAIKALTVKKQRPPNDQGNFFL